MVTKVAKVRWKTEEGEIRTKFFVGKLQGKEIFGT
jgi:hypothetical protein